MIHIGNRIGKQIVIESKSLDDRIKQEHAGNTADNYADKLRLQQFFRRCADLLPDLQICHRILCQRKGIKTHKCDQHRKRCVSGNQVCDNDHKQVQRQTCTQAGFCKDPDGNHRKKQADQRTDKQLHRMNTIIEIAENMVAIVSRIKRISWNFTE